MSDLIPILVGGALTLIGGAGSEWLRDGRVRAREESARRAARQEQRDDFQRTTLIELQDSLQNYVRGIGAAVHFDEMSQRQHGRQTQLPHELSDQIHQAQVLTSKLATRVDDGEIRSLVSECISKGTDAVLPGLGRQSNDASEMGAIAHLAQEQMGAQIRNL